MTAATVTRERVSERTGLRAGWRSVPRELGFLLSTLPIVVVGFSVLITLFATGVGTAIIYIGVFILIATLYAARAFGTLELVRLQAAGMPEIERPRWEAATPRTGLSRVLAPLADGRSWIYLLHGTVVNFTIGVASWTRTRYRGH
ncbi:sensor domain-containing protein [Salinibacterium sp. ZJ450]|uniref:sensor domain-containing protein n=1 Tax=Salinibacterium sp. ZJ450 TaxID=2708338 RepID=UPI00141EBA1D|nr:sensor domain-containing protein [Salinibacterium sp. ZJ450]